MRNTEYDHPKSLHERSACAWAEAMIEKTVQTACRNTLGILAPEFAHFNDSILFGENRNSEDLDLKTRSLIAVVALKARQHHILWHSLGVFNIITD